MQSGLPTRVNRCHKQRWEDFKEERDAYILKKWGYKYPFSAISLIGDGALSLSINSDSPGELGFGEFYEIKPIHIVDVSKLQEVLGYQEPLRIDYANQAEALLQQREEAVRLDDNPSTHLDDCQCPHIRLRR